MRLRSPIWLVLLIVTAVAPNAHAHLMNTGFGPFYDGLTHLFVTPEDLLPVLALALLAGLRGPVVGRAVLFVLPFAWIAGSIIGLLVAEPYMISAITAALTILVGALVAADKKMASSEIVGLAIVLGLLHGSTNELELSGRYAPVLAAAGVACSLFAVVAVLAGQVASVRAAGARLVVRVAGSWIAACGLFMFGWAMRTT
jgi:hydrogenase/urease accessory protein HupE